MAKLVSEHVIARMYDRMLYYYMEFELQPHEYITSGEDAFSLASGVPYTPRAYAVQYAIDGRYAEVMGMNPYAEALRRLREDQYVKELQ